MAVLPDLGALTLSLVILVLIQPYPVLLVLGSSRLVHRPSFGDDNGVNDFCSSHVTPHGYKCQQYEVTTSDGYILSMHRIPEGRVGGGGEANRQPVLLQHGIIGDGATWLLNQPEKSLATILADNGFDVWISNVRGTRYSRRHVHLDPDKDTEEYWNWTWDELAKYELPAMIDLIFKQTNQKIHYVGHSMGTLMALTSFSERRLMDKVKSAALLTPIAYLSHITTPLGRVAARALLGEIMVTIGVDEFNPKRDPVNGFVKRLCTKPGVDCTYLLTALTGNNCCLNSSGDSFYAKYEPQPTSTKNLVHFAQTFRDGNVRKYDHGSSLKNLAHYGQVEPPLYNLSNIPHDLPLFLSYGGRDALSDVKDVQHLLDDLKFHDIDKLHVQYIKDYAHVDFIFGVNANDVVYNQIIAFFRHFGDASR